MSAVPDAAVTAWGTWYDEAGDDLGTAPAYISRESFRAGWEAGAAQAAAGEREACAQLALTEAKANRTAEHDFNHCAISAATLEDFADLIRARGTATE